MKDIRRELLKQILLGKADSQAIITELQFSCPLIDMVPVHTYADEPGLYEIGSRKGLTEEELKEATRGQNIWIIKIHRSNFPLASCEKDVIL